MTKFSWRSWKIVKFFNFIFCLSSLYFLCVTRKYAVLSSQHWNLESTDAGSVRSGKWFLLRLFSFKITHHCLRRITQYWDWNVNKLKKWNRTKRTKKWIPTKSDKIRGPLLQSFLWGNTTLGYTNCVHHRLSVSVDKRQRQRNIWNQNDFWSFWLEKLWITYTMYHRFLG